MLVSQGGGEDVLPCGRDLEGCRKVKVYDYALERRVLQKKGGSGVRSSKKKRKENFNLFRKRKKIEPVPRRDCPRNSKRGQKVPFFLGSTVTCTTGAELGAQGI